MNDSSNVSVRILAYISIPYGAEDYSSFPNGSIPTDHGLPAVFKGFLCDVTVEVDCTLDGERRTKIIDHYGDGRVRATLQEAQRFVLDTTGIVPKEIPGRVLVAPPPTGEWSTIVAQLVQEFRPTEKSREEVESDSVIRNLRQADRGDSGVGRRETTSIQ